MSETPGQPSVFKTTQWTQVLEAADLQTSSSCEAFAKLYTDYWYPLYTYVRRRGFFPAEAEDLTQDFFTRLVTKQSLAGLERSGGRFRSFLLKSLHHFLTDQWDRDQAQKRGGGERPLSLNVENGETRYAMEQASSETPSTHFEKQWALTMLQLAMEQLRMEYLQDGKRLFFDLAQNHLQGDRNGPPHSEIAAQLDMTEGAVKVAVHRMRQRYGKLLRDQIARTVGGPDEVEEELLYLISVLGR